MVEANRQLVMEGNTGDIIDLIDPTQDVLRFLTVKDPLTNNKLSKTERGMALLFVFPFAKMGKGFKFAFHGVEDVERLGKFGKTALNNVDYELIKSLEKRGVKITKQDVIKIIELSSQRIVWLEKGKLLVIKVGELDVLSTKLYTIEENKESQ
ncbi:pre-toxin TG domain-containing protein [Listeria grayi]|uniref:pre-toxin TG domain-containing protein n=1 Tax=Listeria grayi TaxID=1641 RepID=UPI001624CE78|nr:pre-toxin TG domain-containing protein [Listeria grayi]MBC1922896.1 hypothetical protein [Listeria grayi]